ncbi:unnamed protein product, partial [Rotaria sordida]
MDKKKLTPSASGSSSLLSSSATSIKPKSSLLVPSSTSGSATVAATVGKSGTTLQIDRENCDRAMISISFNGVDPLFMYTQLLKETLLDIEDDDAKSIKELAEYCRLQDDIDEGEIRMVEKKYRDHTSIWWYTAPYFIYSMLNRGLRLMDVDIIIKMGFFIRHLHQH